jgi:AcrR family transcriptional regulator
VNYSAPKPRNSARSSAAPASRPASRARARAREALPADDLAEILELDGQDAPLQGRVVQILEVACRLFATHGFDGASMRDIAEECGISKATLYHYFPDKDSILRPLAMGVTKSIYLHVARHDDATRPPLERLRSFLVETARFFESFRWAWIAASTVFWSDPKVRSRKERVGWRDRYEQMLRDILEAGMEAGVIRRMDVKLAGRFVLGSLNWMPRWYRPEGPLTAPEIAAQFCDMIVEGLRAPPSRPSRRRRAG